MIFLRRASLLLPLALGAAASSAPAQTPDSLLAVSYQGASRFRVNIDGGALWTGTYDADISGVGVPAEGAGTRMLWYPRKAAFRAGQINGTQWDAANIGEWSMAMGQNARASGSNAMAFGWNAVAAGGSTVAMGENNTATGYTSVALGQMAHTNARQGTFVFSDRSNTTDTTFASTNHSASFRVRCGMRLIFTTSGVQQATKSGDWGGTGVAFGGPAADGTCTGGSFLGQTSAMISTSTGAYLHTNGTWTNASDVSRKHLFQDVRGEDVLARLRSLPVGSWSYKSEEPNVRHIGPMAQDFRAAFGLGDDDKVIGTVDADGVALAAAKALEARTAEQAAQIEALRARNETLRAENEALQRTLADLARRVEALEAATPKP